MVLYRLIQIELLIFSAYCAAYIRVDEVLADWFGLNQSKYQWALNEYMERKEMVYKSYEFVSFFSFLAILVIAYCNVSNKSAPVSFFVVVRFSI